MSEIVKSAAVGCHMILNGELPDWAGEVMQLSDFCDEEDAHDLPDFVIDPETLIFNAVNSTASSRVVIASLQGCGCLGFDGSSLVNGHFSLPGNPEKHNIF